MKFTCYTLGCKVNQYETQAMEQLLTALGHTLCPEGADCDAIIVNTCTVTAVADRKNRTLIRRLRREHPQAVLGVCGCYAQLNAEDIAALGVDVVSGSAGREEFLQRLLQRVERRGEGAEIQVDEALRRRSFEVLPAGGLAARTRAMLKVQDGCNNFCTYCIIPYARGPVRSEPLATAVAQAKALAAEGYREVVLTGIEIASWGWDFKDGSRLPQLVRALCEAVPELRVRLGSLEPRVIDGEFLSLADCKNLCPQFHLSMQSGCDTVLKRMRRKYDTARYLQSVEDLKRAFPGCAITTDMIVGFPGETEEEFLQSLDFIRRCGFAHMHIFPYSRREGTPAAAMPDQITKQVKEERARRAGAVAQALFEQYHTAMLGTRVPVLFEQVEGGLSTGHAPNGAKVYAEGEALHNQIRTVRLERLYREGLLGTLCGD